ncbi:MAG: ribonuclease D [Pseudomonadota bacterium]
MTVYLHKNDLPNDLKLEGDLAIDTEAMGLVNRRDRLCIVQLSNGNSDAHLVQFQRDKYEAPNLKKLLGNQETVKLFHFARFDVAIIKYYLDVLITNIYCTRTASKLIRTYTDKHGLKELCKEMLGKDISKQQQSSDWGSYNLTNEQMEYAAGDVLYLHQLRNLLDPILIREGRKELAKACFDFISTRALLDIAGWEEVDIFAHQ